MQLLAVLIACGPIYGLAISAGFSTLAQPVPVIPSALDSALTALVSVMLFGGLIWLAMLLLNGELPPALQLKPGLAALDISHGVALAGALLGVQIAFLAVYSLTSGETVTAPAFNAELGRALAGDRWLYLIWLTLVAWLQAGLLEEYTRAFMLSRLWRVWPSVLGRWLALLGSSLVFGLGHAYQGPVGVYGTALIGFTLGWHYLRFGRVLPLVVGHALYNACVMMFLAMPQGY